MSTMSHILNKLRDVDPNNSDSVKDVLTPFFQSLSKNAQIENNQWLRALEDVINRFPKYCISHRTSVEAYLTRYLDSTNYYTVIGAAKCVHALQQVRPPQEKTATPKSNWRMFLNALCGGAHSLITAMFPDAVDIYQQADNLQKELKSGSPLLTALSKLDTVILKPQDNGDKQSVLCTRLRNVFVFIQAMLVEIYPVAKPIRPQTILDVIVRALSVSSGANIGMQNIADVAIIKNQALRTLDALVTCLGPNLLPFSSLVFRIVMQTLKWTSDNPSEKSSEIRTTAYETLTLWLGTIHTHRISQDRGKCWEDELTKYIMEDITPPKHIVELKVNNQSRKNLSKKAKRRLANTMLQESSIASHMPGEKNKITLSEKANDELAIAALKCAETFIAVCGIFFKPATHKCFQERLVRECYGLEKYSRSRSVWLLRALESCRKGTPPTVPPPTQYCLQLYSVIVNCDDREVSSFASKALLDIRLHLHCSPPSLNFAIPVEQETQKRTEDKKRISERNLAALEAYLGADRVSGILNEDVITIADEPTSKRQKLDVDDKVSISSDSVQSVEVDEYEVEVVIEKNPDVESNTKEIDEEVSEGNNIIIDKALEEGNEVIVDEIPEENIDVTETILEGNTLKDVNNLKTQIAIETDISEDMVDSTQPDNGIFEAKTQMPLNISNDEDNETPLSMEVAYDYPSTGNEVVTVLEKLDAENIPSSNETDDIQITCGQLVRASQEVDLDKKSNIDVKVSEVKLNGLEQSPEKPLQNGNVTESDGTTESAKNVTVEDMLADFVDEVNEDTQTSIKT